MIVFTRVNYKNFLASGNAPIEITLNTHPSTLIVGKNGAGKSTLSEAICFALFGRPLRNINKPKLVNSINQRDTLVELDFIVGNNKYTIRRGIKPAVFEVFQNGSLIPSPASAVDYQTLLETTILHLNYKSFMQVVVLGNASYVPFMRLTAASRREIIEDLLDIEVFSSMNALTKDELSTLRVEIDKCTQAKSLIAQQRKMAQSFTEHIEEERAAKIATLQESIQQEKNTITSLNDELGTLHDSLNDYDEVRATRDVAMSSRRQFEKTLDAIESRERKIRKERTFYEEHDSCPTCEQSITDSFKQGRFTSLSEKEEQAAKAIAQCKTNIGKYQTQEEAAERKLEEAVVLEKRIHAIKVLLPQHQRRISELERELVECQKPKTVPTVDVNELDQQLNTLDTKHADMSRQRVIMDAASMLLKDNGIKARVIRHYMPIINKTINTYLTALDFPILFTLDEEFVEHIKSRYRDDFAYESFSEGEKKRIDLALLLTWRSVARLKNSAPTNLLILDEVFDSSLDAAGTEEFLKVIASLEKDTNVFVISHKTDQLVDKFAHTLVFEKTRGFSTLKV